jgi:hypothetical protein
VLTVHDLVGQISTTDERLGLVREEDYSGERKAHCPLWGRQSTTRSELHERSDNVATGLKRVQA